MNDAFAEYDRHPPVPEVKAEATKKIEVSSDSCYASQLANLHPFTGSSQTSFNRKVNKAL